MTNKDLLLNNYYKDIIQMTNNQVYHSLGITQFGSKEIDLVVIMEKDEDGELYIKESLGLQSNKYTQEIKDKILELKNEKNISLYEAACLVYTMNTDIQFYLIKNITEIIR